MLPQVYRSGKRLKFPLKFSAPAFALQLFFKFRVFTNLTKKLKASKIKTIYNLETQYICIFLLLAKHWYLVRYFIRQSDAIIYLAQESIQYMRIYASRMNLTQLGHQPKRIRNAIRKYSVNLLRYLRVLSQNAN